MPDSSGKRSRSDALSASEREFLLAGLPVPIPVPTGDSGRDETGIHSMPLGPLMPASGVQARLMFETLHLSERNHVACALRDQLGLDADIALVRFGLCPAAPSLASSADLVHVTRVDSAGLGATLELQWERRLLDAAFAQLLGAGRPLSDARLAMGPARPLTAIESRLLDRLNAVLCRALERAWQPLLDLQLQPAVREVGAVRRDAAASAGGAVERHVCVFELRWSESVAGRFQLDWPAAALEPYAQSLALATLAANASPVPCGSTVPSGSEPQQALRASPSDQPASDTDASGEIVARLASTRLSGRELAELQVGDLIVTDQPATAPVQVLVHGQVVFAGRAGVHAGQKAVQLESRAAAAEGQSAK